MLPGVWDTIKRHQIFGGILKSLTSVCKQSSGWGLRLVQATFVTGLSLVSPNYFICQQ